MKRKENTKCQTVTEYIHEDDIISEGNGEPTQKKGSSGRIHQRGQKPIRNKWPIGDPAYGNGRLDGKSNTDPHMGQCK